MKTYIRILGILSGIILLGALIIVSVVAFIDEIYGLFVFIIPIFILFHFIIAYRFGFKETENKRIFLIVSLLTLFTIGFTPSVIFYKQVQKPKKPITWTETYADSTKVVLRTRYKDDGVDYIFELWRVSTNFKRRTIVEVDFMDRDGFKVKSFKIDPNKCKWGWLNNRKTKYYTNQSSWRLTLDEYK